MSEKIDRDEPHNQEEGNHEDSLDFAHAGIKAAGRDCRDEEKAGFGEVADLTLGEASARFVNASLELLVEVFAEEADENNVGDGHDGDESEESFPMFEDELESCHGVRKQAGGFGFTLIILAIGTLKGFMEMDVSGALRLDFSLELLIAVGEFTQRAREIFHGLCLCGARGLGGFWGFGNGCCFRGSRLSGSFRTCFCHVRAFRCAFR